MEGARVVRAPRGTQRTAQTWGAEAALRMLQNNLDPEVAERPDDLVVYGGSGKAARDWRCFDAIVETLRTMGPEDTLLVQSGKPVGVMRTHDMAPRVLIANANLVPKWATPEYFRELEDLGLTMYGQMTAGSWIYIGTQGILQGTYATFAEVAAQHFGGTLAGRWVLTAGLGGMGGAQPLAITGNGGAALCIEVDPSRAQRRLDHGYLDEIADSLEDGLARVQAAAGDSRPLSVAVIANAADVFPEMVRAASSPMSSPTRPVLTTHSTATCRTACRSTKRWSSVVPSLRSTSSEPSSRWPSTVRRWSTFSGRAPSSSTMATGFAARHAMRV